MSYDWPVAAPESEGVDSRVLKEAEAFVRDDAPYIQSLGVVRHGKLLWERYWGGIERDLVLDGAKSPEEWRSSDPYPASHDATQVHCIKSCTKSFMSALVGIALREGLFSSVDETIGEILPSSYWSSDIDVRKKAISLRHLLQMRSGLEWLENGPITVRWLLSGDLVGFTLREQAVEAAPGERWLYSTADTHLLSVCLHERSGGPVRDFADRHLLGPLGVTGHRWTLDPNGHNCGGSELFLTLRDLATFGELFLRDGNWLGTQLVPEEWVAESTTPQPSPTNDYYTRLAYERAAYPIPEGARIFSEGYGYKWWRTTLRGHPTYYAAGYGGQYVFVIDDLDIVVVQTASTQTPAEEASYDRMASGYILAEMVVDAISG